MTTKNLVYTTTILVVGLIGLKVVFTLLSTINELPIVPSLFELVGLFVTGKFILTNINSQQRQSTISSIQEKVEELGIEEQVQTIKEVVSTVVGAVKSQSFNIPGWDKVETSVPNEETLTSSSKE